MCSLSKAILSLTNGGGQKKRRQVPWAEWIAKKCGTVERRTVACAAARFAPVHCQHYCQHYCQQRPIHHEKSPTYSEKSPTYSEKSPIYSEKSPTYSEKSPIYSEKSPTYSAKSPIL